MSAAVVGNLTLPLLFAWLTLPAAASLADARPGFPVQFSTERPGKVSVNLFDAQGKLVHQLAVGRPLAAGQHVLLWDGCDDAGKPVPPGEYVFRGLSSDLHSVWGGKVGNTSPAPGDEGLQYRTGHYTDVVALPEGGLLTCSLWGERARMCQRIAGPPDYPVRWSAQAVDFWGPSVGQTWGLAAAADEEYLYVVSNGDLLSGAPGPVNCEGLSRWRLQDGIRVSFQNTGAGDPYGVIILNAPRGPRPAGDFNDWGDPLGDFDVVGLAARGGKLYVPHQLENRVAVLDAATGQELLRFPCFRPRRLALDAGGNLYVTTPGKLLRFGPQGENETVVAQGFSNATGVAVGPKGNIYVTDLGASQQLKVFSPEGKLLRVFGQRGGHKGGRIAPDLLDAPLGVSVGPDETVFVADLNGERVLVLNPDLTLRKEIRGTMTYGMSVSELDRSFVYRFWPTLNLWEYQVDYRTGRWQDVRRWRYAQTNLEKGWTNHGGPRFRRWGGRTFALWAAHGVVAEISGDQLIPRVLLGYGGVPKSTVNDGVAWKLDDKNLGSWVWRDQNADGLLQASEFEFGPWPHSDNYHDGGMDEEGNLYIPNRYGDSRQKPPHPAGILKVPFEGLDEHGIPKYHWKSAKWMVTIAGTGIPPDALAGVQAETVIGRDGKAYAPNPATCMLDKAGNYYVSDSGDIFSEPNRPLSIRKYSPEGKLVWLVGQRQWGARRQPGDVSIACYAGGVVDDRYLFYVDYDGTMNGWDTDGLWIGRLFADLPPEVQNLGEAFHGVIFRHPDGTVYAYSSPDCNYRMSWIRVEGLEQIEHFSGKAAVDQPVAPRPAAVAKTPPWRVLHTGGRPMQMDGIMGRVEWSTDTDTQAPVDLYWGDQRGARCWAQWDEEALYLAWDIEDPTPAVNLARDAFRWVGDQVEFMIRAQAGLEGVSGYYQHGPVEYQMAIGPDAEGRLGAFVQLGGGLKAGALLPCVEVGLKIRPDKSGYGMEARIPWAALGEWRPRAGDEVKWNMNVNWGSPDGAAWDHNAKWVAGLHVNPQTWGAAVFE